MKNPILSRSLANATPVRMSLPAVPAPSSDSCHIASADPDASDRPGGEIMGYFDGEYTEIEQERAH